MRMFLGVTDTEWYRFLSARPHLKEINFWQPSGRSRFGAVRPGELFLFKLKSPHNAIGGGGIVARSCIAPIRVAWEAFGEGNGAPSLEALRRQIVRYRPEGQCLDYTCEIGCIILTEPFFLRREEWIPVPRDWSPNIVTGKTYSSETPAGAQLAAALQERLRGLVERKDISPEQQDMYGSPVPVRPRLGQGAFRAAIVDVYGRRCAVTREKVLPALVAAHIRPVAQGGQHRVDNGLLLRADIHELFDEGYVTVTPDHRFRVSRLLGAEFENGEEYRRLDKTEIWVPPAEPDRPNPEFLEWHADVVFRR